MWSKPGDLGDVPIDLHGGELSGLIAQTEFTVVVVAHAPKRPVPLGVKGVVQPHGLFYATRFDQGGHQKIVRVACSELAKVVLAHCPEGTIRLDDQSVSFAVVT